MNSDRYILPPTMKKKFLMRAADIPHPKSCVGRIECNEIRQFTDATHNQVDGFRLSRLEPDPALSFTTHAMSPGAVLTLCSRLYGKTPAAYLLEIAGMSFELREGMSVEGGEKHPCCWSIFEGVVGGGWYGWF